MNEKMEKELVLRKGLPEGEGERGRPHTYPLGTNMQQIKINVYHFLKLTFLDFAINTEWFLGLPWSSG